MDEFSLIDHFFKPFPIQDEKVIFGIGDDAACVEVPSDQQLLVSTDTLVSGVHFLPNWNPADIAAKAALANISDMAAMGADPCWVTLALTLPILDKQWLASFSRGLREVLQQFHITLIGGDTTHGSLALTLTIMGLAPRGKAVRRSGAQVSDLIFVSGPLGAAALSVHYLDKEGLAADHRSTLMDYLVHPKPRLDLSAILRTYATAALDISDGLSADLNHLCVASKVGARLYKKSIPVHPLLDLYLGEGALDLALRGGDDYELCFTVPEAVLSLFAADCDKLGLTCYPIGVIEQGAGLRMIDEHKKSHVLIPSGYTHF